MKKIILIFTLLSLLFAWSCNRELDLDSEWSTSARTWESKLGDYRGQIEVAVEGLPMDTIVQQVTFLGDDYNDVFFSIDNLSIQDERVGSIFFRQLSFKEENGVIYLKGNQNSTNSTSLGLVTFDITGEIKNKILSFDLKINGVEIKEFQLKMKAGRFMDEFPSRKANIEAITLVEEDKVNSPFITGVPAVDISSNVIVFFVADSLTITDSTTFSVRPSLELSPGAWIEPDSTMNWTVTHYGDDNIPSKATTDSLFTYSELDRYVNVKVWAADSIQFWNYIIGYRQSSAIPLSLFHWENRGAYSEPIAGWASNNAYLEMLSEKEPKLKDIYTERILGAKIGDIGARVSSAVIGTVKDSTIEVISGKLFRGLFDMDSIDTPKKGELHGIPFSKRKPVTITGQYRYFPGKVLYVGDSIVPDSVLNYTDSCYIEAFIYESLSPEIYLDSLNYLKDEKVIGHAKFVGGQSSEYRGFTMHFDIRNWVPTKRYHLGIVCRSSGKSEDRVGSDGSILDVSGFELMSTEVLF